MSIIKFPNQILRKQIPEFDFNKPSTDPVELEKHLIDLMLAHDGIGLAANQAGIEARVFVIGHRDSPESAQAFFNPTVVATVDELEDLEEGCLSFPDLRYPTPRAMRVVAKGFNMYGDPIMVEGSELLARAIQHETDHLDGIVFIDRLTTADRKLAMKEIRESEWFGSAIANGTSPVIKVSPHFTNGLGN